jgi:hypothetical protein
MTLKELEPQLLALSDSEKAQAVQLLSQGKSSTTQGIEKTPGVCGGSACVAGPELLSGDWLNRDVLAIAKPIY